MQITIDATPTLLRSAGVKTYIYHWLVHLRQVASPTEKIAAFPFLDSIGNLSHASSTLGSGDTLWRLAVIHLLNLGRSQGLRQLLAGTDIFHISNHLQRAPRGIRLTSTLYDL